METQKKYIVLILTVQQDTVKGATVPNKFPGSAEEQDVNRSHRGFR